MKYMLIAVLIVLCCMSVAGQVTNPTDTTIKGKHNWCVNFLCEQHWKPFTDKFSPYWEYYIECNIDSQRQRLYHMTLMENTLRIMTSPADSLFKKTDTIHVAGLKFKRIP
jgi:hypothetical protein